MSRMRQMLCNSFQAQWTSTRAFRRTALWVWVICCLWWQPFECEACPMKLSIKRNLVRHQQFHLGVKNYACSICTKKFTEKHTLTAHFRLHTDERPFACKICRKTFRHSGNLAVHMRTHTGEKPYECPYCMKRFSVSSSCHRHVKAMHSRTENFSVSS